MVSPCKKNGENRNREGIRTKIYRKETHWMTQTKIKERGNILFIYLFIFGLFNNPISSSDHTTLG
jgi:hypothetical protein